MARLAKHAGSKNGGATDSGFAHAALTALGSFCKMAASKHVNNYLNPQSATGESAVTFGGSALSIRQLRQVFSFSVL